MHPENEQAPEPSLPTVEVAPDEQPAVLEPQEVSANETEVGEDHWRAPEDEERPRHDHLEHGHAAGLPPSPRFQLPADDPFWQFGTPIESWGSTKKTKPKPRTAPQVTGPRPFIECRRCGVKLEQRGGRAGQHQGRTACPMCGRWMVPGRG
ncbi:MAG: hypothetical protein HUU55_10425 [Myxococcales bacterium]|nr:hypothetical protein [Myxococcales bacterium]